MARIYFAKGCRGAVVESLQRGLVSEGCAPAALVNFVDGDYGEKTATAVRNLQVREGFEVSGAVDELTWQRATHTSVPSLFDRALQLTADFEGHGFGLVAGNFDGAGVTWGIIGFTLKGGELARVMREIERTAPGLIDAAFGELAGEWRQVLAEDWPRQQAWADSVSLGEQKAHLQPAWVQAFARLGARPEAQQVQVGLARHDYYVPALASAQRLGLGTERGVALCFDTHVQSGGVAGIVFDQARQLPAAMQEPERLRALAEIIASAVTKPKYRAGVLARRMCIATGQGIVHGGRYDLQRWGLDLVSA